MFESFPRASQETPENSRRNIPGNRFEVFSDSRFLGRFRNVLADRSGRVYKNFKRVLAAGMIAVSLTQGGLEPRAQEFSGYTQRTTESSESKENKREKREVNLFTEADIEKEVFDSPVEEGFVSVDGGKTFMRIFTGGKVFVNTDFTEIEKHIERDKTREVIDAHIHPVGVYAAFGYTKQELADINTGKVKPRPVPPSCLDIDNSIALEDYLASKKSAAVRFRVYDPTGAWEYKIDDNNPTVRLFKAYQHDRNDKMQKIMSGKNKALIAAKRIDVLPPDERIEAMLEDPETKQIGEKMEKLVSREIKKYGDVIEGLSEIEFGAQDVRASYPLEAVGQDKIKLLIEEYVETCKEKGIEMGYRAYEAKEK